MRAAASALLLLLVGCGARLVEGSVGWMHARAEALGLEARALEETPGERIAWRAGGEGPPLMLLHGFGGDGVSTWFPQLEPFIEGRRLIVPDLLWFGGSRSEAEPGLEAQARAMLRVLDAEGVARVDLMGVSYGGFVAMELLRIAPQRVRRLVIVDSPGGVFSDEDITAMARRFGGETAADVFVPRDGEGVRTLIDLCFVDPPELPRWIYDDIHAQLFNRHHAELTALLEDLPRQRAAFFAYDWSLAPERLIVWGEHDAVFPLSEGRELAAYTRSPLVVIPDTAHGPNFEEPERFNALVTAFLDRP